MPSALGSATTTYGRGLVYPTYYSKLYPDAAAGAHRRREAARGRGDGLWPRERSDEGNEDLVGDPRWSSGRYPLPKLFRADHTSRTTRAEPVAFLVSSSSCGHGDRMVIISTRASTGFRLRGLREGQTVKLTSPPKT